MTTKQKPIVLINAPKRAGKDYTAQVLGEYHYTNPLKFATPMYEAIPALFQIPHDEWAELYESHKEEPSDLLMGMSPREAMIWVSEDVMKPKFGDDVFGKIAAKAVDCTPEDVEFITFSDSGFASEAKVLVDQYGAENVYLVRIYADGCDFVGDSRGLIAPDDIGITQDHYIEVYNDKTFNYDAYSLNEITTLIFNGERK